MLLGSVSLHPTYIFIPHSLITMTTMTTVISRKKAVAVNPLKLSQPLGASLAFLGLKGMMPLFHGSQGCTAFAKVILVRHFREAIPLSTTAMSEVSTILGGEDNIEGAILTLVEKANPEIIGLLTTALTETRGDDMQGILKTFREKHPELDSLPIPFVSTPDYKGALEDGYAAAVEAIVTTDFGKPQTPATSQKQVTVLAGSMLSPGDIEEIKAVIAAFDLSAVVVPDISGSLDGHLEDDSPTTTSGGTSLEELRRLGESVFTIAIGESMRDAAVALQEKYGIDFEIFPRLSGLQAVDNLVMRLAAIAHSSPPPSGGGVEALPVPQSFDRQRRQVQDAMLDTHFFFGGKKICLALEPDLLFQTSWLLQEMGSHIQAAVTTSKSPVLERLPIEEVVVGDLEDFENLASGCDLLIANSHGVAVSRRLGVPIYRMGYPVFDRLGNSRRCHLGYRGTMELLFEVGNIFLEAEESASHH